MEPKKSAAEQPEGVLSIGALLEIIDWEKKMMDITEYESTNRLDSGVFERDESGP